MVTRSKLRKTEKLDDDYVRFGELLNRKQTILQDDDNEA